MVTVDDADRAHIRTVKLGERVGELWIVESGLRPGERVVADGVQKVREGLLVVPHPFAPAR